MAKTAKTPTPQQAKSQIESQGLPTINAPADEHVEDLNELAYFVETDVITTRVSLNLRANRTEGWFMTECKTRVQPDEDIEDAITRNNETVVQAVLDLAEFTGNSIDNYIGKDH